MNISRLPRVRISGALLLASSTLAIAMTSPAQADTTAPCNTGNGPDAVADTSDDLLWQRAREQVLDIYETEYSLFGHLGDTVLRAA